MEKKKKKSEEKQRDDAHVQLHMNIFVQNDIQFFPSVFLFFISILERKLFNGPREKIPGPHNLFFFLPT